MPTLSSVQAELCKTLTPLDARLLLAAACDMTAQDMIINAEQELPPEAYRQIKKWQVLREAGMPVARILGMREFYGLCFKISSAVLDPRPDSELLIDTALAVYKNRAAYFLDIGTGSGCLAITLLHEQKEWQAKGIDISRAALRQARINAARLGVRSRLALRQSNWLNNIPPTQKYDFIISNPPYIRAADIAALAKDVRDYDPLIALDGGGEGLSAYRKIIAAAPAHLKNGGHIFLELGDAAGVRALLAQAGFSHIQEKSDLGGRPRVIIGQYYRQ